MIQIDRWLNGVHFFLLSVGDCGTFADRDYLQLIGSSSLAGAIRSGLRGFDADFNVAICALAVSNEA
jgi:hypothetical protein